MLWPWKVCGNVFWKQGLSGHDYDLTETQNHDFTQALGFCLVLLSVFNLATSAPLCSGLVCTSFCWINRSTAQRGALNHYLGSMCLKHVAVGNLILYRNLLIFMMRQSRCGLTLLKQPLGSCMPQIKWPIAHRHFCNGTTWLYGLGHMVMKAGNQSKCLVQCLGWINGRSLLTIHGTFRHCA